MRGKKFWAWLLTAALLLGMLPAPAMAADTFGDFEYEVNHDTVTITDYSGSGSDVEIPAEINGKSVTAIGNWAFSNCTSLTSITIPESVTSIGEQAFQNCSKLKSVVIPNSVTSIRVQAFQNCYALESVVIPNSVTSIGAQAFQRTSLASIIIPESVTSIGEGAFQYCYELKSVVIPNSVTSIGRRAFQLCSELKSVVIPNSVTSIGEEAFQNCYALESVVILNVTSIGSAAFDNCERLTSVKISGSVTAISDYTFNNCKNLTEIELPNDVKAIGKGAFHSCHSLASIEIPDGVKAIGENAFYDCPSLASIEIPDSVETIGEGAFAVCTSLSSITIPNGVTTLEDYIFWYTSLASIEIPNGVTTIGSCVFADCTSLMSITIPNSVTMIGSFAFAGCSKLESVEIPDSVTLIDEAAFEDCTSLNLIVLPDGCDATQAEIPNGATQIRYTVDGDGNVTITSITLGEGQTEVTLPTEIGGRPVTKIICDHEFSHSYVDNKDGRTHNEVCDFCKQAVGDPERHTGKETCTECEGEIGVEVTITWGAQETLRYTGKPDAITPPTVTPANGEEFTGTISYSYEKDGSFTDGLPTNVGTYTVRADVARSVDYKAASADTSLTIEKARITVTAEDKTAAVGGAAPALTYTVTGLAEGESLKTEPTVAYETAPDMSKAGTTAIKASGAEAPDGGNYEETITYVDGTLTVRTPIVTRYTVVFDSQGGSAVSSQAVTAGGKAAKPSDPIRSGYDFGGWYRESACTTAWNFDTDTVTGDITLYARWTARPTGGGSYTPPTYPPTVERPSEGGTVTVSPSRPSTGDKVTIRPKPDNGYEVDKITVTDRNGNPVAVTKNQNGTYTFTQPNGTVKVEVSYKATETTPAETVWNNPFTDIAAGAWYYDAVRYVKEHGLMNGYTSTAFGPNDFLSRAQLAQLLYNKEGKPAVTSGSVFTDVTNGQWYTPAVTWAAANGIVNGYGNGTLGPNDNITREQLAVMLWRYTGSPAATNKELHFNDIDEAGGFAMDALGWAVENGILNGYGNGQLDPKGLATRAQVAQMLKNYLENQ